MPRVSVVMPVYNGGAYLAGALESILSQRFCDFEVIAIDDASTDGSAEVLSRYADDRVRVIRHERNEKLPATLNHGLDLARGEFVARMDADDISHPLRFEKQVSFLEMNPDVGICGSWVRLFGSAKPKIRKYPITPGAVEAFRFFHCPFAHPSVMVRSRLLDSPRLRYDPAAGAVEDFNLWTQLLRITRGANIPEPLLDYRMHHGSVTSTDWSIMDDNSVKVLKSALAEIFPDVTDEQARFHRQVAMAQISQNVESLRAAGEWLGKIAPLLDRGHEAREVFRQIWFRLAMRVTPVMGLATLGEAMGGSFPSKYGLDAKQRMLILASAAKASLKMRG